MNRFRPLLLLTFLTLLLADCKKDNSPVASACTPPAMLTAQAQCESGYSGALLMAKDYQLSTSTQFEYQVFIQKDTLSGDISNASNKWSNASNERIIVPDAVLKDAPKFLVRVIINCRGTLIPSGYFAFVKRPIANSNCYVWGRQTL